MNRRHPALDPYKNERRLIYIALLLILIGFLAYIYFVSASIVHVVMHKEVDRKIAERSSIIGDLEATYIASQHEVSADIASLHGFTTDAKKIFLDPSPSTLVLSR